MTSVLCDTSVVVKWFHERGEAEVVPSRAILDAHAAGKLTAVVLDLTVYELGNVAARPLGLPGDRVAEILDRLELICDEGLRSLARGPPGMPRCLRWNIDSPSMTRPTGRSHGSATSRS